MERSIRFKQLDHIHSNLLVVIAAAFQLVGLSRPVSARNWTDAKGKYSVEADFVGLEAGVVTMKTDDGRIIHIAFDKLSQNDQRFIRNSVGPNAVSVSVTGIAIQNWPNDRSGEVVESEKELRPDWEGTKLSLLLRRNDRNRFVAIDKSNSRIIKALDDTGADLLATGSDAVDKRRMRMIKYKHLGFEKSEDGQSCTVDLFTIGCPNRSATEITVDGSLNISFGVVKEASADIKLVKGAKIDCPPFSLDIAHIAQGKEGFAATVGDQVVGVVFGRAGPGERIKITDSMPTAETFTFHSSRLLDDLVTQTEQFAICLGKTKGI